MFYNNLQSYLKFPFNCRGGHSTIFASDMQWSRLELLTIEKWTYSSKVKVPHTYT